MTTILDLIICGASGHAKVVADAVHHVKNFRVVGFVDTVNPHRAGEPFMGSKVLGGAGSLDRLRDAGIRHAAIAFGACGPRLALADTLRRMGFELPAIVHPTAVVANSARLGDGAFIAAGAIVGPDSSVGDCVIINTRSSVDHDCTIHGGAHICPGATLAGGVRVGERSWVGIGSTVIEKIAIGRDCLIAAGAVVIRDVPDDAAVAGCPAREMRRRVDHQAE